MRKIKSNLFIVTLFKNVQETYEYWLGRILSGIAFLFRESSKQVTEQLPLKLFNVKKVILKKISKKSKKV